ncbi:hypothetical protein PHJA_002933100 [Phtheirospermum japonicum]|uniref:Uncharacterized protein n=1 Tax=Phtheirospermum japonicum TaxID=374723 RepID=A0A830D700_9LAMI|nr:hypothetical protein PHJA_002933100 [Phtheirospermum japonicum]
MGMYCVIKGFQTELSEEEKARSKRFKKEEKGSTSSPHKYEYESSDEEIDWWSGLEDIDRQSPEELQYAVGCGLRSTQDQWTFVDNLAETPAVEAAEKLLKSLKGDGNGCTDCETAFKELWGDGVFLDIIRNGCQQNPYFSNLLVAYDKDGRVSRHDERMSYVKDDPILKTELGPSAHVMRKAMCLTNCKGDVELRVELEKLYGGNDEKFNKALHSMNILDGQSDYECLVDHLNLSVAWTVTYEPEEGYVPAMRISRKKFNYVLELNGLDKDVEWAKNIVCWLLGVFEIAKVGHFVLEHVKQVGQLGVGACGIQNDNLCAVQSKVLAKSFVISYPHPDFKATTSAEPPTISRIPLEKRYPII